jgi:hypothetical protein
MSPRDRSGLTTSRLQSEPLGLFDASAFWLARLGGSVVLAEVAWHAGLTSLVGRRLVQTSIWEYRYDGQVSVQRR